MKTLLFLAALQGFALPSFATDSVISCDPAGGPSSASFVFHGDASLLEVTGERMVRMDGLYYPQKIVTEASGITGRLQLRLEHQNGQRYLFVKVRDAREAAKIWEVLNPRTRFDSRSIVNAKVIEREYRSSFYDGDPTVALKLLYDVGAKLPAFAGFCSLKVKR